MAFTILVVDDSTSIRKMVESALRFKGYDVVTAADGIEALEALKHGMPPSAIPGKAGRDPSDVLCPLDLVVLDINMPHIDGLSVLKAVRERAEWADLPVLMLTTEGRDTDRERALRLGATDYIVKPFKPTELLRRVAALLAADAGDL